MSTMNTVTTAVIYNDTREYLHNVKLSHRYDTDHYDSTTYETIGPADASRAMSIGYNTGFLRIGSDYWSMSFEAAGKNYQIYDIQFTLHKDDTASPVFVTVTEIDPASAAADWKFHLQLASASGATSNLLLPTVAGDTISWTSVESPTVLSEGKVYFDIANDADCFAVYTRRKSSDPTVDNSRRQVVSAVLEDPNGSAVPFTTYANLYCNTVTNFGNWGRLTNVDSNDAQAPTKANLDFPVPVATGSLPATSGKWALSLKYQSNAAGQAPPSLTIVQRHVRPSAKGYVRWMVTVKATLYTNATGKDVQAARDRISAACRGAAAIFQQASLDVVIDGGVAIVTPPAAPISDDFFDSTTGQVVTQASGADFVPLLFVDGLVVSQKGTGGKSGGIPGPHGFRDRFGAVLIPAPMKPTDTHSVNPDGFARVVAHELGHYLGLTHGSAGTAAGNLMVPKAGLIGDDITTAQTFILRHVPIVRVIAD